jgi:repressor LexA
MEPISPLQHKMYELIVHAIEAEGMPPTNRELGRALGMPSTGHVNHHLNRLEKKGWIRRVPGKSRGIQLRKRSAGIPLKGAIAAGAPLDIYPDSTRTLPIESVCAQEEGVYALLVRGQSMIEDCICDGDYVIIKPLPTYHNGDIVVATHLQAGIAGSATLKRLFQEKGRVRLQPANAAMEPLLIPKREWNREWQVQGKVIAILRHYGP